MRRRSKRPTPDPGGAAPTENRAETERCAWEPQDSVATGEGLAEQRQRQTPTPAQGQRQGHTEVAAVQGVMIRQILMLAGAVGPGGRQRTPDRNRRRSGPHHFLGSRRPAAERGRSRRGGGGASGRCCRALAARSTAEASTQTRGQSAGEQITARGGPGAR